MDFPVTTFTLIPTLYLEDDGALVRCVQVLASGQEFFSDYTTIYVDENPPPTGMNVLLTLHCQQSLFVVDILVCPPGQSSCLTMPICLDNSLFCDGAGDCPDGNDEFYCRGKCRSILAS